MQCSDLERYLEAYLDLRLGRSRGAILRRHLAGCPACRARIERLRLFERDLQRRFRAMEHSQSIWGGLEPDLVRSIAATDLTLQSREVPATSTPRALPPAESGLPPRLMAAGGIPVVERRVPLHRPGRLRWSRRMMGIVLLAATIGIVVGGRPAHDWFGRGTPADAPVAAYRQLLKGDYQLDYETAKVDTLQNWFATTLGTTFRMPSTPVGFTLVGGRLDRIGGERVAAIVYSEGSLPTLLLMRPSVGEALATQPVAFYGDKAQAVTAGGFSHYDWQTQDTAFSVISPLSGSQLMTFVHEISGEPL
jgi:anti-sigma factor RsiW